MKPLILKFTVGRTETETVPYSYDFNQALNTVTRNGVSFPFIDSDISHVTMGTRTKVQRDKELDGESLIELSTKTRVRSEKDDHRNHLLELETKTAVKKERDD